MVGVYCSYFITHSCIWYPLLLLWFTLFVSHSLFVMAVWMYLLWILLYCILVLLLLVIITMKYVCIFVWLYCGVNLFLDLVTCGMRLLLYSWDFLFLHCVSFSLVAWCVVILILIIGLLYRCFPCCIVHILGLLTSVYYLLLWLLCVICISIGWCSLITCIFSMRVIDIIFWQKYGIKYFVKSFKCNYRLLYNVCKFVAD